MMPSMTLAFFFLISVSETFENVYDKTQMQTLHSAALALLG